MKAFDNRFYQRVCKATLDPVLRTCELATELGIHVEVTYLVIPGLNDAVDELRGFCSWVATALGKETPVHFTRFHPDYKMTDVPRTPFETLEQAYTIARESGLLFPYVGNVPAGDYENTVCPNCGHLCIERHGFTPRLHGIDAGCCSKCGTRLAMVT